MTDTIVVVIPGETLDRYGATVADWENPAYRMTVSGCAIAPRYDSEDHASGRHGVVIGLNVYAPVGTSIPATARVEAWDELFEVDGEPSRWDSPWDTPLGGVEVQLRRVQG